MTKDLKASMARIRQLGQERRWSAVLGVLGDLRKQDVQADIFIFGAAVSTCEKSKRWREALHVLCQLPHRQIEVNLVVHNSALSACEKGAVWRCGTNLLRESAPIRDVITCNAAISACEKASQWMYASTILQAMILNGPEPDVVSVNAATSACARGGRWMGSLELAWSKLEPNIITLNAAISACSRGDSWEQAVRVANQAAECGFQSDSITRSAAMSAFEACAEWCHALAMLSEMRLEALRASITTYGTMVSSCKPDADWAYACDLMYHILRVGLAVDLVTCNAMVSGCDEWSQWRSALLAARGGFAHAVSSDVQTYGAAISAAARAEKWGGSCALLRDMRSCSVEPNAIAFSAALGGYENSAPWACALAMLNVMACGSFEVSGMNVGAISNCLRKDGCWEAATCLMASVRSAWSAWIADVSPACETSHQHSSIPQGSTSSVQIMAERVGVVAVLKLPGVTTERVLDQLQIQLRACNPRAVVSCVSRLDISTSGVLVAALGRESSWATQWLMAQYSGRYVGKEYIALCVGKPLGPVGSRFEVRNRLAVIREKNAVYKVHASALGKEARTSFLVLATYVRKDMPASQLSEPAPRCTLVHAKLHTGRMHQIRAHLAGIGRPLLADPLYNSDRLDEDAPLCPRTFLHCRKTILQDLQGVEFSAEATLLPDLLVALGGLILVDPAGKL